VAHFYGTARGNRSTATRCGTKTSGMETYAASWQGAVRTILYTRDGVDYAHVKLTDWYGTGTNRTLYDGPVGEYKPNGGPE
jgi:hypothetical protein